MTRVFLIFSGLIWSLYGAYIFVEPGFLAEAAGVSSASPTGTIELRAMYGGLEFAIGLLLLAGAFRPGLTRPALLTLVFLCAGLAFARLIAVLPLGEFSDYTVGALVFEFSLTLIAGWLLSKQALSSQNA